MQFNQEQAQKSGQFGISTGAHIGAVTGKKVVSQKTGAQGIELSLTTREGDDVNYLSVYYQKGDGSAIGIGTNIIQAIMGCLGLQGMNIEQLPDGAPVQELKGQPLGLVLQKVLYNKLDGSDTYKFEIKQVFSARTRQTFKEYITKSQPAAVDALVATLDDRDDRKPMQQQASSPNGWGNQGDNNWQGGYQQNSGTSSTIPGGDGWDEMPADF
ncbi:hypothetical protein L2750_14630 [Shewanella submarina]|uniref:DUF669 domain-containing protein n=1 Tax=Shewanella submarina TaxID=2016376 RepID=A0ABV7GCC4_9GAMM|nr:hypothetical protein [Shewanella submarina]MCL1038367.1 hypothetical protein [Shewanella submarina]